MKSDVIQFQVFFNFLVFSIKYFSKLYLKVLEFLHMKLKIRKIIRRQLLIFNYYSNSFFFVNSITLHCKKGARNDAVFPSKKTFFTDDPGPSKEEKIVQKIHWFGAFLTFIGGSLWMFIHSIIR